MKPFTATYGERSFDGFIAHEDDMPAYVLISPCQGMGGWGNGYVAVPEGHPAHGMGYDEASDAYNIRIHGGLTYAAKADEQIPVPPNSWVFGFDTLHYNDSNLNWPDENAVMQEALLLREQLLNVNIPA